MIEDLKSLQDDLRRQILWYSAELAKPDIQNCKPIVDLYTELISKYNRQIAAIEQVIQLSKLLKSLI